MNKNIITLVTIVAILIIAGGVYYFGKSIDSTSNTATTTPVLIDNTVDSKQAGKPLAITNPSTASSDTTVVVSGTVTPNGALTRYWYEYSISGAVNQIMSTSQTVGSGFVGISAPSYITGLIKDTNYDFRLVAENQYGRTTGAKYSFKTTTGNLPPIGGVPTVKTVSANGITRSSASLNGEVTPNKAITQFWFEYGQNSNLGNITAFQSVGDGSSKSSVAISLSNLNPLTTYYFRINAQNQFGTVNGTILNFKTSGPQSATAPVVVTKDASDIKNSSVTLHGTVNPSGAETTYWFEYSTKSLVGSVLPDSTNEKTIGASANVSSVEADLSGLDSKITYYFRLVAQNSLGLVRGDSITFKTK
jgi:hypothetical protein